MLPLALIVAGIFVRPLACGDFARRVIEATGIRLAISHRASGRARYERIAGLSTTLILHQKHAKKIQQHPYKFGFNHFSAVFISQSFRLA